MKQTTNYFMTVLKKHFENHKNYLLHVIILSSTLIIITISYWRSLIGGELQRTSRYSPGITQDFLSFSCSSYPLHRLILAEVHQSSFLIAPGRAVKVAVWTAAPRNNTTISILPGQPFCIRIFVENGARFVNSSHFQPIPGHNLDSIEIYARGKHVFIPFDVHPAGDHFFSEHKSSSYRVYENDIALYDKDDYTLDGIVEYLDGSWNLNQKGDVAHYLGWSIFKDFHFSIEVLEQTIDVENKIRSISRNRYFPLEKFKSIPLCNNGNHAGRWIPKKMLPVEYEEHLPPLKGSNNELVWVPYSCRYKPYSSELFETCVTKYYNNGILWYGDSNSRRSVKKLASKNEWCAYPVLDENKKICNCEDGGEKMNKYFSVSSDCTLQFRIGTASVNFNSIGGLTGLACKALRKKPSDNIESLLNELVNATRQERNLSLLAQNEILSLLLVGLVNWDAAFEPISVFKNELGILDNFLSSLHGNMTLVSRLILRSGQFFCCTTPIGRLYTRMRLWAFNKLFFGEFQQKSRLQKRIGFWDTYILTSMLDRRGMGEKYSTCPSAHVESEVTEIENQVLMNLMCNENSILRK